MSSKLCATELRTDPSRSAPRSQLVLADVIHDTSPSGLPELMIVLKGDSGYEHNHILIWACWALGNSKDGLVISNRDCWRELSASRSNFLFVFLHHHIWETKTRCHLHHLLTMEKDHPFGKRVSAYQVVGIRIDFCFLLQWSNISSVLHIRGREN
jgi:hypothetical protein